MNAKLKNNLDAIADLISNLGKPEIIRECPAEQKQTINKIKDNEYDNKENCNNYYQLNRYKYKAYYEKNKEKAKAYYKTYYQVNKEKYKEYYKQKKTR